MSKKNLTIKTAIAKGRLIQDLFPECRSFYLAKIRINGEYFPLHFSIKDIAEFCWHSPRIMKKLQVYNFGLLQNAVRYALLGNDNTDIGEVYPGLLTKEEYYFASRRNRINSGREAYLRCLENKVGLINSSKEQLREYARMASVARGQKPWTEEEIKKAYQLKDMGYNAGEIGRELGRTRYAVLEMFRRESKKGRNQRNYAYQ